MEPLRRPLKPPWHWPNDGVGGKVALEACPKTLLRWVSRPLCPRSPSRLPNIQRSLYISFLNVVTVCSYTIIFLTICLISISPLDNTFHQDMEFMCFIHHCTPSAYPNACVPQDRHLMIFTQWIKEWMDGWVSKLDTHPAVTTKVDSERPVYLIYWKRLIWLTYFNTGSPCWAEREINIYLVR